MTKTLTPYEKKRKELLTEMTPPTREVALDFEKKITLLNQGEILVSYDMGARMKKVLGDESVYGANAAIQLAAYLGMTNTTRFYNLVNMSEAFDRKWIASQAAQGLSNGQPMRLGHFLALSLVKLKKDLEGLLTRVRQESISVNDLELEVKAKYETKNTRSGGRNPGIPKSPEAGLQKSFSLAQQLSNYLEKFDDTILPSVEEIPPDDMDEKILERFERAETQLVATGEQVEATLQRMAISKKRVLAVLKQRAVRQEEANAEAHEAAKKRPNQPGVTKGKEKSKPAADFDDDEGTAPAPAAPKKKNKKKHAVPA